MCLLKKIDLHFSTVDPVCFLFCQGVKGIVIFRTVTAQVEERSSVLLVSYATHPVQFSKQAVSLEGPETGHDQACKRTAEMQGFSPLSTSVFTFFLVWLPISELPIMGFGLLSTMKYRIQLGFYLLILCSHFSLVPLFHVPWCKRRCSSASKKKINKTKHRSRFSRAAKRGMVATGPVAILLVATIFILGFWKMLSCEVDSEK